MRCCQLGHNCQIKRTKRLHYWVTKTNGIRLIINRQRSHAERNCWTCFGVLYVVVIKNASIEITCSVAAVYKPTKQRSSLKHTKDAEQIDSGFFISTAFRYLMEFVYCDLYLRCECSVHLFSAKSVELSSNVNCFMILKAKKSEISKIY